MFSLFWNLPQPTGAADKQTQHDATGEHDEVTTAVPPDVTKASSSIVFLLFAEREKNTPMLRPLLHVAEKVDLWVIYNCFRFT